MGGVEIAWMLADIIGEHLHVAERHHIYVALGSGDVQSAILGLVSAAARDRVLLPHAVVRKLLEWEFAYDDVDSRIRAAALSVGISHESHAAPSSKTAFLTTARRYRRSSSPDCNNDSDEKADT